MAGLDHVLSLRKHIEKFIKLNDEDWALVAAHLSVKQIKKHQFFAQEGKIESEVGFVIDGMFRQYYIKDGDEKTTYFFFEQSFLCSYISCLTQQPSLITIEALSHGTYVSFPYRVLTAAYEKSKAWEKFGRLVAEDILKGLEERMVGLLLQSPEERYRELLEGNKKNILERVPQHYIANYLGITPVSMSRIRNRVLKSK